MTSLLSRLEAAPGPSRELDAEIALANGWTFIQGSLALGDYWRNPTGQSCPQPPRYTEDVQAVLRDLMPPGLYWLLGAGKTRPDEPLYGAQILNPSEDWKAPSSVIAEGESNATPALALLIALEKAKEASKP